MPRKPKTMLPYEAAKSFASGLGRAFEDGNMEAAQKICDAFLREVTTDFVTFELIPRKERFDIYITVRALFEHDGKEYVKEHYSTHCFNLLNFRDSEELGAMLLENVVYLIYRITDSLFSELVQRDDKLNEYRDAYHRIREIDV